MKETQESQQSPERTPQLFPDSDRLRPEMKNTFKRQAAKLQAALGAFEAVVDFYATFYKKEQKFILGLGTGSTAECFLDLFGEWYKKKPPDLPPLHCVASSQSTRQKACQHHLPLVDLNEALWIDVTVDGTDEFDPSLNLIKGGGGALLYEKLLVSASKFFIVMADSSKESSKLGRFPLPIEIVPFGYAATCGRIQRAIEPLGYCSKLRLRQNIAGEVFITEGGHYIVDCAFEAISDASYLSAILKSIPGIVEHGLFLNCTNALFIGTPDGFSLKGTWPTP